MAVLERLSRLIVGGEAAARDDAVEALARCYIECTQRARRVAHHAELAPNEFSAAALREVAASEDALAGRVRDALRAAGAVVPTVPDAPALPGATNLWGRLVQDLEAFRAAARQLRELAVHFAQRLPTTADLFNEICHQELVHCERLRALIARADPQALN